MIRSFKNRQTEQIAQGEAPKGFPSNLIATAQRKLFMVEQAKELKDLRSPPGNRLESLKGNRAGSHSFRVNDQYRVCFRWIDGQAEDVEIVDYH